MPPAITVEDLSKRYRIGAVEYSKTFREAIMDTVATPLRRLRSFGQSSHREQDSIWALKDVSFDVQPGEVVGLIGPNGAGKSTLLKILSRITDPTEGGAVIDGRVASLLEVGTGFHQELTGRENIHLSGAVLGMSKKEIRAKFDEIVDFSGVETFIDTPVKRYSSGMQVRLGFAVAAHLEPEILLIDEVLAVGDAAFQKKCLGKMNQVAEGGRTVLFVSHNMAAVNRLCQRGIWLDKGQVHMAGPTERVTAAYLSAGADDKGERSWKDLQQAPGNEKIRVRAIRIKNHRNAVTCSLDIRHPFFVEIEYEQLRPIAGVRVGFRLLSPDGTVVLSSTDRDGDRPPGLDRLSGVFISRCEIPGEFLNKGQYAISVGIDIPMAEAILFLHNAIAFSIESTGGIVGDVPDNRLGLVCPALPWTVEPV
jgi:lipopolysaccharide transport system ATP-binding protein